MSGNGHDDGFTGMGVTPGMPEKIFGSGVGQSRLGRGISTMGGYTLIRCMNVKTKGIENGQFVSE